MADLQSSVDYGNTKTNQHALVPPKTECGCPSGGGIKNSHIRYTSYGGTQKEKKEKLGDAGVLISDPKIYIQRTGINNRKLKILWNKTFLIEK